MRLLDLGHRHRVRACLLGVLAHLGADETGAHVGPSAVSSAPAKPPVASTRVTPAQSAALDAVLAEWVTNHTADSSSLDLLPVGNPGNDWSVGEGLFGGLTV